MIKDRFKRYEFYQPLADRTLAMVFEKASTRTRVSFEAGMYQMGGSVIHITTGDSQLGRAEPIEDTARVISRMVDIVMIRTYEQTKIERFAEYSRVPVINGLTNEYHPCQILADIFTFLEHRGPIAGRTVAWIGDANNMAYTWLQAARVLGFRVQRVDAAEVRARRRRSPRPARTSRCSTIRWMRRAARTWSPPTSGPAWASRPRTRRAPRAFADWQVDARNDAGRARPMRSSCTACLRIAARKSPPECSTARNPSSGTRRKTACTCKRP